MTYRVCGSCEPLPVQVFRAALTHPVLSGLRIQFPEQRLVVDQAAFARVLRAVNSSRLPVSANLTSDRSWSARYLFSQNRVEARKQIWPMSNAIHEAVHVLQDEARVVGPREMVESAAYAVDFIFRRRLLLYWGSHPAEAPHPSIIGLEGRSPFEAALEPVVVRRGLLAQPRGSLSRRDLQGVERAVRQHYGGTVTVTFDGIDLR